MLGKYRNKLGVELVITGVCIRRDVIGILYEGEIRDSLFGTRHMYVTLDGLSDCGYVKVEGES